MKIIILEGNHIINKTKRVDGEIITVEDDFPEEYIKRILRYYKIIKVDNDEIIEDIFIPKGQEVTVEDKIKKDKKVK